MVSVYLSTVPFILAPSPKYLIGATFLLFGILLYYSLIYKKKKFCCIGKELDYCKELKSLCDFFADKISRWIQLLFEVAPPGNNCEKLLNGDTK